MQGKHSAEIETIVRLVVERLRNVSNAARNREANTALSADSSSLEGDWEIARKSETAAAQQRDGSSGGSSDDGRGGRNQSNETTLRLDATLVTFDALDGKMNGISTLQIPKQAVVTPLVHDELRQRKIKVERVQATSPTDANSFDPRLLLVLDSAKQSYVHYPGQVITGTTNCKADVGRIAAHINGGGSHVVWSANRPYSASVAAAGTSILRSIVLPTSSELQRATAEVDPNLIIVDGQSWSAGEIDELARHILKLHSNGGRQ